jgi:hypothetical protein
MGFSRKIEDGGVKGVHKNVKLGLMAKYPQVKSEGFARAICAAVGHEDIDPEYFRKPVRVVPDGYALSQDERVIDVFEIEILYLLSDRKLEHYAKMMVDLDCYDWTLNVFVVSRHGHINQIDLRPWYYKWLSRAQAVEPAGVA